MARFLYRDLLKTVRMEASGKNAKNLVERICDYHRIQASPGFRQAAEYCLRWLRDNNLENSRILEFPADAKQTYWGYNKMPKAWRINDGELKVVSPKKLRGVLSRFRDVPTSVIQRCSPTPPEGVEAEVVVLEDGTERLDYENTDVKGKIVLTSGDVNRVAELAVDEHGAVGIITDRMPEYPPIRHRMDLGDAYCYTSFWGRENKKSCPGFVVTPKQGERLRKALKEAQRKKRLGERLSEEETGELRVHASIDCEFFEGTVEDVVATIQGREEEDVLIVAHLCHPLPSANDNASGAAALMETARCLKQLIDNRKLPKPRRSIKFLLVPEMTGTYAYLATHEEEIPRIVAGLNLDMVGEDQDETRSPLLVEKTPDSTSSCVNALLAGILEQVTKEGKNLAETGEYALIKWSVTPFSGGSDHYILSDPTVGIPTPMIIHWPDMYYHTSLDTPDKVSEEELERVVTMTATYAFFLANAGYEEAVWLANEVVTAGKQRLSRVAQDVLSMKYGTLCGESEDGDDSTPEKTLAERIQYTLKGKEEALGSVTRLLSKGEEERFQTLLDKLEEDLRTHAEREKTRSLTALDQLKDRRGEGITESREKGRREQEEKAARMVPVRVHRGPISWRGLQEKMTKDEREAHWKLMKEKKKYRNTLQSAVYWADGERSLLEISRLVKLEVGHLDLELLIKHFQTLGKHGFIMLEENR